MILFYFRFFIALLLISIIIITLVVIILALQFNSIQIDYIVTAAFITIMIFGQGYYALKKYFILQKEIERFKQVPIVKSNKIPMNNNFINRQINYVRQITGDNNLNDLKVNENDNQSMTYVGEIEDDPTYMKALDKMKHQQSIMDKQRYIQRHLDIWKTLLLKLSDDDSSSSSMSRNPGNQNVIVPAAIDNNINLHKEEIDLPIRAIEND